MDAYVHIAGETAYTNKILRNSHNTNTRWNIRLCVNLTSADIVFITNNSPTFPCFSFPHWPMKTQFSGDTCIDNDAHIPSHICTSHFSKAKVPFQRQNSDVNPRPWRETVIFIHRRQDRRLKSRPSAYKTAWKGRSIWWRQDTLSTASVQFLQCYCIEWICEFTVIL